jgi:hypothetical protein
MSGAIAASGMPDISGILATTGSHATREIENAIEQTTDRIMTR